MSTFDQLVYKIFLFDKSTKLYQQMIEITEFENWKLSKNLSRSNSNFMFLSPIRGLDF